VTRPFPTSSLQNRIYLLAVLTCLLLVGAAGALLLLLRNNESSILAASHTHLATLAHTLAQDYVGRSAFESADNPRSPHQNPLAASQRAGDDPLLSLMTSAVLQHEIGIEGGFYSRTTDTLLGYAFPTHEGPGDKKDIPGRERPAISDLARKAVLTGQPQSLQFIGARDAVLFSACPITVNGAIIGATWMMHRLPGVNAGNSLRLFGSMAAFALGALACALVAFIAVAQTQASILAIANYLDGLRSNLASSRPPTLKLAEFEDILKNVDSLASTLQKKIENERTLEARINHQERLSSLGQFAAGIAHEIRNPLATIRLRTQMSQRARDSESVQRNAAVALEEIARLDAMIERLLYFSRPIRHEREMVDLAAILNAAAAAYADDARRDGINITVSAESPAQLLADAGQIRQVIDNVIRNAIDAVCEQPTEKRNIACRIVASATSIELRCEDSGPGFSAESLARALDAFYTTRPRGTGLGLSISYEIMRAHDGRLLLANHEPHGAAVTLQFPAANAQPESLTQLLADKEILLG
jgi:signal transduction histidine kinase